MAKGFFTDTTVCVALPTTIGPPPAPPRANDSAARKAGHNDKWEET